MPNDPKFDTFRICRYTHWDLYISERGAQTLGRVYFWLRRDNSDETGIIQPHKLTVAEKHELEKLVEIVWEVLVKLFKPYTYNLLYQANEACHGHHCHFHLVPRYPNSRVFDEVTFEDKGFGHPHISEEMPEELAIAVSKKIAQLLR